MASVVDLGSAQELAGHIEQLVNAKNTGEALYQCLINAPRQIQDIQAKELWRDVTLFALSNIKDDQIDRILEGLEHEQHDTLLAYIYRGFALGQNCAALLKWHSKLISLNGPGGIVRCMSHPPL